MGRFFVACTPRTGNLWFRKMLANSLEMTDVAAHTPAEIPWDQLPSRCVVAMHWECSPAFRELLRAHRFVPVVTARHPLDVLISILHFCQSDPTDRWLEGRGGDEGILRDADPASERFLQYALSERAAALLTISAEWLHAARSVVRYENLVDEPARVLGQVLDNLGVSPRVDLPAVVEAHTIGRLRPISRTHFWRGTPGLWRKLLPTDYRQAIYQRHRRVFDTLGYDCDCPTAPTPEVARQRWLALCAE